MRISLALIVFAISCGPVTAPDKTTPEAQEEGAAPVEIASSLPLGCAWSFGETFATETASGERLSQNGGTTDHASVVTVYVTVPTAGDVVIRYDATARDCARASFRQAVPMIDVGLEPDGQHYTGVIPAFPADTHVCWKILAPACGVLTSAPAPSMPSFDYTTK